MNKYISYYSYLCVFVCVTWDKLERISCSATSMFLNGTTDSAIITQHWAKPPAKFRTMDSSASLRSDWYHWHFSLRLDFSTPESSKRGTLTCL